QKGFNSQQVSEAINQADIKGGVEGTVPPPGMAPGSISPIEGAEPGMKPSALNQYQNERGGEMPLPVPSPGAEAPAPEQPSESFQQQPQMFQQGAPQMPAGSMDIESIQEVAESIIDERWQEVVASIGDITLWKSKVEDDIASIKQEVLRMDDRFTKLQAAMIGKVDEYQKGISKVGNEMAALEQVFGKIMEPLTTNIKELQRITQDLQKKK
ncbi:MAG: hypothetical protein KKA79_08215, partial [Nanoarchaeota archaeon]|nr:hypothetical protein [Nanoarchaeota archaeon]